MCNQEDKENAGYENFDNANVAASFFVWWFVDSTNHQTKKLVLRTRVVCVVNLPSNQIIVKKFNFIRTKKTSCVITVDYFSNWSRIISCAWE
jgi:hypothetical protein